jgi:hypothetical protein
VTRPRGEKKVTQMIKEEGVEAGERSDILEDPLTQMLLVRSER